LIENNIFYYLRHAFLAKEGAIGNVFAYNYSLTPNGSQNDIAMHGHYGQMNLLEGNVVQKIIAGDYWGPSGPGNTYFRNRVEKDDIVMQDFTHAQNIIANELVNGTVNISGDSKNTWQHSNMGENGIIDNEYRGTLPPSLYLKSKPDFLESYSWPVMGPEYELNSNTIPAVARWESGTNLVPCLDTDFSEITSAFPSEVDSEFHIYPNPTSGVIHFESPPGVFFDVEIYNMNGQEKISAHLSPQNSNLDLSLLKEGVYMLKIKSMNTIQTTLLIKSKY